MGKPAAMVSMRKHVITVLGKNPDGTYDAGETAGGQRITLSIAPDGSITGRGWMIGTRYTAIDATVLAKA